MAIGALLTWYLIADAKLFDDPREAADIAEKALDVAQNPKIDNYFFSVLLRIVMAKANFALSDLATAKIYITDAIEIAKKYGMNDLLCRLYLLYGKYFQEQGLKKSPEQAKYLEGAKKMYELAQNLFKQTRNTHVHIEIEEAKSVLKAFMANNKI